MTDRAQSNTLGFILLFSVLLASLGVVATAGVDTLESGRDVATSQNVEQSIRELADAGTDVHRENVSVRTARMRLGSGQLRVGEATEITVNTTDTTGVTDSVTIGDTDVKEVSARPITYSLDGRQVTYEGTAVVRQQDGGSVLVREPDFHLDPDGGVITVPVVNTTPVGDTDSVGGGQAEVRLLRNGANTTIIDGSDVNGFNLTVDPPAGRVDAWEAALESSAESSPDCSVDPSPGGGMSYTCSPFNDDATIIVRHVKVSVDLGT